MNTIQEITNKFSQDILDTQELLSKAKGQIEEYSRLKDEEIADRQKTIELSDQIIELCRKIREE